VCVCVCVRARVLLSANTCHNYRLQPHDESVEVVGLERKILMLHLHNFDAIQTLATDSALTLHLLASTTVGARINT